MDVNLFVVILCYFFRCGLAHILEQNQLLRHRESKEPDSQESIEHPIPIDSVEDNANENLTNEHLEDVTSECNQNGEYFAEETNADESPENLEKSRNVHQMMDHWAADPQLLAELKSGDRANLFGSNIHTHVSSEYKDFGRRFVPQYPYSEKHPDQLEKDAEDSLDKSIKKVTEKEKVEDGESLKPVRASPELVLALAKESSAIAAAQPINPADEIIQRDIMRSGDYWDSFWEEEVDVDKTNTKLRSKKNKQLETIRVKIMPGSKLYKLVTLTQPISPKLLYIMNIKDEK